ncbi:unnamed protein product [Coregonus sp. 'balchen']|nr:unnamed protein product [Coregonus sp. 'balchen']
MPLLFLERFPWPSLQTYTALSAVFLAGAILNGYYTVPELVEYTQTQSRTPVESDDVDDDPITSLSDVAATVRLYLVSDTVFVWVMVNTACCVLMLIAKVIQCIVFGPLRVSEKQTVEEVVMWCLWFAVLVFLHLMVQLCKDRFEYLSFSPTTPMGSRVRVLALLVGMLLTCCGLALLCGLLGNPHGMHTCMLVSVRTGHGTWESKGSYVYYTDFVMELALLGLDLMHHIHMLLFGNIWLSMASLVIFMQLRYLFHEVQKRIRRHKNYLRVINNMEARFAVATSDELIANNDDCAICWDSMMTARKLPCGHLFHHSCLRSWLEQDTSCPTCQKPLMRLRRKSFLLALLVMVSTWLLQRRSCWTVRPCSLTFDVSDMGRH